MITFLNSFKSYRGHILQKYAGLLTEEIEEWMLEDATGLVTNWCNYEIIYPDTKNTLKYDYIHVLMFWDPKDFTYFKLRFM